MKDMYYEMTIAGCRRALPLCPISDTLNIGAFVIFGDPELTTACAQALIERAPDLPPEEIAGGEKTEQKAEADVNAIEEKILASFRPAAEEAAPEKAQETAPAEEQSAPKAEEPKAEPLEPDDSPFVETASHAIRLDDLKFGRNYHGEE